MSSNTPTQIPASLAGAYNALAGLHRDAESAMAQKDLLPIFESLLHDRLRMANTRWGQELARRRQCPKFLSMVTTTIFLSHHEFFFKN